MSTPTPAGDGAAKSLRVSILSRLIPCFAYGIPAAAALLSSILVRNTLDAMRMAESAGVAAVAAGLIEANLPTLVGLYLAIVIGLIGMVVGLLVSQRSKTTAPASGWFFLLAGILGLTPVALLCKAESLLLAALGPGGNVSLVAERIRLFILLAMISAVVGCLLLLIISLVPLPSALRARRSYGPLFVMVVMEIVLIGMAVVFQLRSSWLHQV